MKETYYCEEMSTLCLASLGRCPAPVDVQDRLAVLQFEQGQSLSHRIYNTISSVPQRDPVKGPGQGSTHLAHTTLVTLSPIRVSNRAPTDAHVPQTTTKRPTMPPIAPRGSERPGLEAHTVH